MHVCVSSRMFFACHRRTKTSCRWRFAGGELLVGRSADRRTAPRRATATGSPPGRLLSLSLCRENCTGTRPTRDHLARPSPSPHPPLPPSPPLSSPSPPLSPSLPPVESSSSSRIQCFPTRKSARHLRFSCSARLLYEILS